tara:strand:- start:45 stop:1205 length:1161 start_codon:yes stop_codon:yes gene_type:complete
MPPKRKKKKLVIIYDEPKIPAGHVRGDDGKIRKKKLVIKYAQPLQNVSANASALSASAPSSTSRMELPDDILSLVNQFAKPIKDRGLIRTNPSKWTKVDMSNFLGYLLSEDVAYAPEDDRGPQFDMESEYYNENMSAYYDIHNEQIINSLLATGPLNAGGSTGKLDGKTYRELGNIVEDLMESVTYFNDYSGRPFDDQLEARFERDLNNKANARIKKNMLREIVSAINTFIPSNSSNDSPQFSSVSKKMLTVKINNQAYFDKIKKMFVWEDENILDKLAERIMEVLYQRDIINNEELYQLEQEDIDDIENKTKQFINIFIKRLVNDMLKESVPFDEMLRSVYWLYEAGEYYGEEEDFLMTMGGQTNYSETMSVASDFASYVYERDD